MNFIERPKVVKAFASQAMQGDYLPVRFGTNIVVPKTALVDIANDNFELGLESLEKDLQLKDLNTVLFYNSTLIKYLFERGVTEFSAYQSYPAGAVVTHNNQLWIATRDIKASLTEPEYNQCNPCGCDSSMVCGDIKEPSKENGWCQFVTHCTYDVDKKNFDNSLGALQESIDALKGVANFGIIPNPNTGKPELKLTLSNGEEITIPMDKFGKIELTHDGEIKITNADGSEVVLPKPVYSKELDTNRGFFYNVNTKKWEVDLADLIKSGSGLETDREGNIKVKPSDFIDGSTLSLDPNTGKIRFDPEYEKAKVSKPLEEINTKLKEQSDNGAKVFTKAPISGNGRKDDPITIKLGSDFTLDSTGTLVLANNNPATLLDVKNGKYKLGFHTFNGEVNPMTKIGSLGLPRNFHATTVEENIANTWEEYAQNIAYDFNGYYIASGNELDIWVMNGNIAWLISNDWGVNDDGTLKNPQGWSKWKRLDNVGGITDEMVKRLQEQVNTLAGQVQNLGQTVQTLQNRLDTPCEVTIQNVGSHTVANTDNLIISTGGTVTFPDNLGNGRSWTVIQSTDTEVVLAGNLIAPINGGLKLQGKDAAVTVVKTGSVFRVFGSTKR